MESKLFALGLIAFVDGTISKFFEETTALFGNCPSHPCIIRLLAEVL